MDTDDPALPAKTATKLQPIRGRQPAPGEKQESSTAEPTTTESKNGLDEKAGLQPDLEQPPAPVEKRTIGESRGQGAAVENSTEKATLPSGTNAYTTSGGHSNLGQDQQYPTTVVNVPRPAANQYTNFDQPQHPDVKVEAPTPTLDQEEKATALDRTEESLKRDSDVEMTDAPPAGELVDEGSHERKQAETAYQRVDLPPPPPMPEHHAQLARKQTPPLPVVSSEKQKWLLPPIQPHFKGRKCLVLDLDETLVHSSFKVDAVRPVFRLILIEGNRS